MTKYLPIPEVAAVLRVPAETLRYWRHVGKGPKSFKIGRRVLFDEVDLRTWIAEQRAAQDNLLHHGMKGVE